MRAALRQPHRRQLSRPSLLVAEDCPERAPLREDARRLGLVSLGKMIQALVAAVERPPASTIPLGTSARTVWQSPDEVLPV
jgi:hypothetical protein